MVNDIDFVRSKIKGNIAEIIFQNMFSDDNFCTVIPFGYEKTNPLLAQYQSIIDTRDALKNIRTSPDYILMKPDFTDIVLVDVKYRRHKNDKEIWKIAKSIGEIWITAWIFLATLDDFYFAPCSTIIENKGDIPKLRPEWIKKDRQEKYLALLHEFLDFTQDEQIGTPVKRIISLSKEDVLEIGNKQDSKKVDELIKSLQSTDYETQRLACSALGKLGLSVAEIPLTKKLSSQHAQIRQYAIKALGKLGTDYSIPFLNAVVNSKYETGYNKESALLAIVAIKKRLEK